jgi:hypothetical protein
MLTASECIAKAKDLKCHAESCDDVEREAYLELANEWHKLARMAAMQDDGLLAPEFQLGAVQIAGGLLR